MRLSLNIPTIPGHEQECETIRALAAGRLTSSEEWNSSADMESNQNFNRLCTAMADLGSALFAEKRLEECEAVMLLALDNDLVGQPAVFDRLIKIYMKKKNVAGLNDLLGRKQLAAFEHRNTNQLADRIREGLRKLNA